MKEAYDKEFAEVQTLGLQYAEYVFILAECQTIESMCDSLLKQINALDINASFAGLEDSRAGEGDAGDGAVLAAAAAGFCRLD